jgi:hypothetical protein
MIGSVTENEEAEALAALNSLNIARLSEVISISTLFITRVERNFISYFDIFAMSQK